MAARLRKTHQEDVRTKIQVSQLLNVLQNHALGKLKDLSPSRLKAIEILLKKTLPDLSHTQGTGTAKAMTLAELLEEAARKEDE
jgi:DNA repair protein RadC